MNPKHFKSRSGHNYSKDNNRIKRKLHDIARESNNHRRFGSFIKYSDLLQQLAADLRKLQLNKNFHCSSQYPINSSENSFLNFKYLIIQYFILNFLQ